MNEHRLAYYQRLPKVELHLHLEGAIPLPALWQLIQMHGGDPEVGDMAALERKFAFRDFPHFIDTWIWKNQFLRSYDDFTFIAEAVAWDLAQQHIRYVEAFYSPSDFRCHGLTPQRLTAALRAGLDRVPAVEVALIADLVRDEGPARAAHTLAAVNEVRDLGVIGVGLGGSEQLCPAEPFAPVYAQARALGFHTTAHAGEAAGPESVWAALRDLGSERIGHAARAREDPALIAELARRQVPLEICPISNVRTGVVPSLMAHPIRHYVDQGCLVTINTDDPKMFGNSLAEEYLLLETVLGFAPDEIQTIMLNGIRASWLPQTRKAAMVRNYQEDPAWSSMAPTYHRSGCVSDNLPRR